jgi:citrate synthase
LKYQQRPRQSPVIEALNKLFILHADHEQNCSTSTVRMVLLMRVYSRQYLQEFQRCRDLYGGANQAVLEMLEEIHQNNGDTDIIWQKPKVLKNDPFRLMGLALRVQLLITC